MTQGATAGQAVVPCFPKFSCHTIHQGRITSGLVKALLPARVDFPPLARVGSRFLACSVLALVSCKKNELADEAKAAGLTTADFLQITAGGSDHGKQRQTKA